MIFNKRLYIGEKIIAKTVPQNMGPKNGHNSHPKAKDTTSNKSKNDFCCKRTELKLNHHTCGEHAELPADK